MRNQAQRVAVSVLGLGLGLGLALSGCSFESPDNGGTTYTCPPPAAICPAGFSCVDGVCVVPEGDGPDAGGGGGADAAETPPTPDAGGGGAPDAAPGEPDAPPSPDTITLVFGESGAADQTGVTTDTSLDFSNQQTEFGNDSEMHIDADPERIALLRFDLSAIPTTATVESAEITIAVSDPIETGDYRASSMALSWQEANANYIKRTSTNNWPVPGAGAGSFIPGDIVILDAPVIGSYTVPVDAAAVQAWVSDPAANFGMRWFSTSPDGRGGRFFSSEAPSSADRPLLRVTFH